MKKVNLRKQIIIATPIDPNNFGNRMQNYAVHEICKKLGFEPVSLIAPKQCKRILVLSFFRIFRKYIILLKIPRITKLNKMLNGWNFTIKNINTKFAWNEKYINAYVKQSIGAGIGGDQIWSYYWSNIVTFCEFPTIDPKNKICFAPSIGSDKLTCKEKSSLKSKINNIDKIAVREDTAVPIITELTGKIPQVIIDPVLMLNVSEWQKIQGDIGIKKDYALVYCLGHGKQSQKIKDLTAYHSLIIKNIMDINNPELYSSSPQQFLTLIENSRVVFTDSYHGVLFSLLYNIPVVLINRIGENGETMNTRFDQIVNKYNLSSRYLDIVNCQTLFDIPVEFSAQIENERNKAWSYYINIVEKMIK